MIRNNNPGNIRASAKPWVGQTGKDSRGFVIFDTLENGYRAHLKLLQRYTTTGADTIATIINRWAPPSENDTGNYISFVEKTTGIPRGQRVTSKDVTALSAIAYAQTFMEHGAKNAKGPEVKSALFEAAKKLFSGPGKSPLKPFTFVLTLLLIAGAAMLGIEAKSR